ncbi:MAG: response regulator [Betaproteobacteria bacterium]|nr:response regulator [Betaproteobacteria bacterium]
MPIRTVMVVDDSATDRHVLAEMLASGGYVVIAVASAEEAQMRIRTERPDAILMDIVMPGKNGFEATRELQRNDATRDIPVIVCTSKSQPTDRIWALRQGAREVLVKPVQRARLLETLARLG